MITFSCAAESLTAAAFPPFESFDSPDYLFEIKHDGFRALAYVENGDCRLISRNSNMFRNFGELEHWIANDLNVKNAILDGEIVCLDEGGRSVFRDVLYRRRECRFFAFDLVWLNDTDLRSLPLLERKARLKLLIGRKRSALLYVDHIEDNGRSMFEQACRLDLEGIVAEPKKAIYSGDTWGDKRPFALVSPPSGISLPFPHFPRQEPRQPIVYCHPSPEDLSGAC